MLLRVPTGLPLRVLSLTALALLLFCLWVLTSGHYTPRFEIHRPAVAPQTPLRNTIVMATTKADDIAWVAAELPAYAFPFLAHA